MSTSSNQARIKHTVSILKATTYSNADISAYYFSAVLDAFDEEVEGVFRCQCGTLHRQSPRTGYSNLMSHIRDQHHDYQEVVMEADMGAGTLAPWIKQSAKNMHGWLDWIISSNLQLQFCKRATTRRYTNLNRISVESLKRAMGNVTLAVEAKIKAELPSQRCGTPSASLLIGEDGGDHSAEGHRVFLDSMLQRDYDKSLHDCLFTVGDNCAVNRRLATIAHLPLIGCASHRLNFAVQAYLQSYKDELDSIPNLMRKLRTLNHAAKLRAKTSLRPVLRHDTRWSSTYAMVGRYFCLAGFIEADDEDMCELMPSPRSVKRLLSLLSDLKRIEYVSKSLQCGTTTILDVRLWFDGLIEVEPSFAEYLAPRARIVHSPDFESGCTKVLDGEGAKLTWAESAALEPFAIEHSESEFDSESGSSTSNMVERFQSRPRHVWTRAPFTEPVHARNDFVSC
ncbi:hypothetical protein PPTG_04453 [Phytophthora nicotianae INRA-310]|uniref:Uncharacterized protein n=1 Tax=Phytophthora nicotianae (strain INRA-310) TaxID=761204 RepID=W2R193_PHYN3|nr:hypothetical protein PPTG_04453 [Phytophthora nicotianae INRA-310]ETN19036.1 hypothetical protein PPTG_04453 [Phytophthora nicotianae INRA-310]